MDKTPSLTATKYRMANNTFVGFSTSAEKSGRRSWILYDVELIKQDLMNHFHTRLGERVMRPEFGCRIWDYIMEPNIEQVRNEIVAECERVVRLDTRLDVDEIKLFQKDHLSLIHI